MSRAWLSAAPEDREALLELSYAQTNLGALALEAGSLSDAAQAFEESVRLKRRGMEQLADDKRDRALSDLAGSLSWLGQVQLWRGELPAALRTFQEALEVLAPLRRAQPGDAPSANREAILNRWLGETLTMLGRSAEAVRAMQVAQARFSELVARDASNRAWASEALITRLMALEAATVDPAAWREELAALGQQLSELESAGGSAALVRRLPDRARWARLSLVAATHQGRPAAALQLQQVRERLREAVGQRPEELRLVRALARIDELVLRGAAAARRLMGSGASGLERTWR